MLHCLWIHIHTSSPNQEKEKEPKMYTKLCLVLFSLLLLHNTVALGLPGVKTKTFLSPPFYLKPGEVANKYYFDISFPRGHIALKSFNGEVVDEYGNPIPLHETYLHHWVVDRYYGPKNAEPGDELDLSKIILVRNSGLCPRNSLGQYYGLGSETRKTDTWVPDPYGIVVGNPEEIPAGYEERWLLNVHAIDTRGVEDKLGCTECRCGLYNVTIDEYGHAIRPNYTGGLYCCYDGTQCKMRGVQSVTRKLFLKYTVKWVNWEPPIIPVKIYILDVTDSGTNSPRSCKVEYEVEECNSEERANGDCIDTKITKLVIPHGGDIIYGVAHQHSGGAGSALYGQDGRLLCTSIPSYGEGQDAGNEANYIVGMSTCYPKPGSVKIADGETVTLFSNYSSNQMHTGVMGLFYILVAEEGPQPKPPMSCFNYLISWCSGISVKTGVVIIAGASLISITAMGFTRFYRKNGYEILAGA